MGTWVLTLTEAYGLTKIGTTESCAAGRVPWPVLGLVADVVEDADMALGQGPARRRRKQGASAAWWVLDVRAGRRRTGVRVAEGVRPGN